MSSLDQFAKEAKKRFASKKLVEGETVKVKRQTNAQVVEVSQGTCSNITEFAFADLTDEDKEMKELLEGEGVKGYVIKTVDRRSGPSWGHAWYIAGKDGKLKVWKHNYDSSG